jgi:membrane protein YfhO
VIAVAARPSPYQRVTSRRGRARLFADALSITVLLAAVALSCANGFINGVVAYERDTSVFYYPLFEWASQQLHKGQFPLWCAQMLGGYPIFADSELGLASPAVLLAMLALPTDAAFVVLRLVFVGVAAVGAYALARAWNLTRPAAVIAGLTFSLGSFLPAHIVHENIVRTAAWLPATLTCIERAFGSRGRTRRRWMLGGAATTGFAAVGLHPEILLVNLVTVAVYGLLRSWSPFKHPRFFILSGIRNAVIVGMVAPAGLALAAVQLVPLAELGPLSARAGLFPYSEVAGQTFTPFGLIQLLLPYVFRGPDHLQWGLWAHWESYLYVGLAPLVLAMIALWHVRHRRIWVWVVLGLCGLITSMGQYSPLDVFGLLWRTPGLGWLRAPGRFELLVVLALSMLAAHGMSILQARARQTRAMPLSVRLPITAAVLATPLLFAFALSLSHAAILDHGDTMLRLIQARYLSLPHDQPGLSASDVYAGLLRTTDLDDPRVGGAVLGLFIIVTAIVLWQRTPSARLRRWSGWPAALIVFASVDLLAFGWGIHPRQALSILATPDPAIARLHQLLLNQDSSGAPARVLASPVVQQIAPDRLVPLGIQDAGGYSSLDTAKERSLLLRVERVDDDLLDLLDVRYVLDPGRYGALPSFQAVQYSPRNPLVDAGNGGDLADETFTLHSPVTPTEIRVISALENAAELSQGTPVADIVLRSPTGVVVARMTLLAGEQVMDWSWDDLRASGDALQHNRVEAAGEISERLPDGEIAKRVLSYASFAVSSGSPANTVEITTLTPQGRMAIFGVGIVDSSGGIHQLFGRRKTKYREISSDQTVSVLENTAAYPRAFLVSRARVAPPGGSLDMMQSRPFDPHDEVILAADTRPASMNAATLPSTARTAPAPAAGMVRITRYSSEQVAMDVVAPARAFLVLTDAFYPGWQAFIDGREWPVLRGDVMFRVIDVPAGEHAILFQFRPTSIILGLAISAGTLLLCLALLVAERRSKP